MKFPIKRGKARGTLLSQALPGRVISDCPHYTMDWTKNQWLSGKLKRFAVRTFLLGRIHLVGTDLNRIKSTVIGGICMIRTILDGTLDTFVRSVYFHGSSSFMNGCL